MSTHDIRRQTVEELNTKLENINSKLDEAELKATLAKADASDKLQNAYAEARQARTELQQKINVMAENVSDEAVKKAKLDWAKTKAEARKAMDYLSERVDKVKSLFKDEPASVSANA